MLDFLQNLINTTALLSAKVRSAQLLDEAQALADAKEYKGAVACLQEAADLGSIQAAARLATCYLKGQGIAPDWKKATELFEKIPKGSGLDFLVNLGMIYAIGGYGLKRNIQAAKEYLRRAIDEDGDEKAGEMLAMIGKRQGIFGQKEVAKPKIPWKD